jgi:hypothetical protein
VPSRLRPAKRFAGRRLPDHPLTPPFCAGCPLWALLSSWAHPSPTVCNQGRRRNSGPQSPLVYVPHSACTPLPLCTQAGGAGVTAPPTSPICRGCASPVPRFTPRHVPLRPLSLWLPPPSQATRPTPPYSACTPCSMCKLGVPQHAHCRAPLPPPSPRCTASVLITRLIDQAYRLLTVITLSDPYP